MKCAAAVVTAGAATPPSALPPSAVLALLERGDPLGTALTTLALLEIAAPSPHATTTVPLGAPLFVASPPAVEFRGGGGGAAAPAGAARLSLRNADAAPRRVRVLPLADGPTFSVDGPFDGRGCRLPSDALIAPGTEAVFTVAYAPGADSDSGAVAQLVVVTERESFAVPLRAAGARALLQLPDAVELPTAPAGAPARATFTVRNAGCAVGAFSLTASDARFALEPARGVVSPGGVVAVTVTAAVGGGGATLAHPSPSRLVSLPSVTRGVGSGGGGSVGPRSAAAAAAAARTAATAALAAAGVEPSPSAWTTTSAGALAGSGGGSARDGGGGRRKAPVPRRVAMADEARVRAAAAVAAAAAADGAGVDTLHATLWVEFVESGHVAGVALTATARPPRAHVTATAVTAPPAYAGTASRVPCAASLVSTEADARLDFRWAAHADADAEASAQLDDAVTAAAAYARDVATVLREAGVPAGAADGSGDNDDGVGTDVDYHAASQHSAVDAYEEGACAGSRAMRWAVPAVAADTGAPPAERAAALLSAASASVGWTPPAAAAPYVPAGSTTSRAPPRTNDGDAHHGLGVDARARLAAMERAAAAVVEAALRDPRPFASRAFTLAPAHGALWPRSAVDFTLAFTPAVAGDHADTAYLEIGGRGGPRVAVSLRGTASGPTVAPSFDVVAAGAVTLSSVHRYALTLANTGAIPAPWCVAVGATGANGGLDGRRAPAPQVSLEPDAGTLAVGESATLEVYLTAARLGAVDETLTFTVAGAPAPVTVRVAGTVEMPSFHVDAGGAGDWGTLAYGFPQSREVAVYNTSDVPLDCALAVEPSGSGASGGDADGGQAPSAVARLFAIDPPRLVVAPGDVARCTVTLNPAVVGTLTGVALAMRVAPHAAPLATFPIRAAVGEPALVLAEGVAAFGEVFVGHPTALTLTVRNPSPSLPARFALEPQDPQTAPLAMWRAGAPRGALGGDGAWDGWDAAASGVGVTVPPGAAVDVPLQLTVWRLGAVALPLRVHVAGSSGPPLLCEVVATARGPRVAFAPAASDGHRDVDGGDALASLDAGRVPVLSATRMEARLRNDGPIAATVHVSVADVATGASGGEARARTSLTGGGAHAVAPPAGAETFTLHSPPSMTLAPGESVVVAVAVRPDDCAPCRAALIATVDDGGGRLVLPLTAEGVGATLSAALADGSALPLATGADDAPTLDFGDVFFGAPQEVAVTLRNDGRRQLAVAWVNRSDRERADAERAAALAAKRAAAVASATGVPLTSSAVVGGGPPTPSVFTIVPPTAVLLPGAAFTFRLVASVEEAPRGGSSHGGGAWPAAELLELTSKPAGELHASTAALLTTAAAFFPAMLRWEPRRLAFLHEHTPDAAAAEAAGTAPADLGPHLRTAVRLYNPTPRPLVATLSTTPPLSVEPSAVDVPAGDFADVVVSLDPSYRGDRVSHVVRCAGVKLTYAGHARTDVIPAAIDLRFPNLAWTGMAEAALPASEAGSGPTYVVDFGATLPRTAASRVVAALNTSQLPVDLEWSFEDDEQSARAAAAATGVTYVPVSRRFDVLPTRARIEPGTTAAVEFTFRCPAKEDGGDFSAWAVGSVCGGPTYRVQLTGRTGVARYKLDARAVSFGTLHFASRATQSLLLANSGDVPLDFNVAPPPRGDGAGADSDCQLAAQPSPFSASPSAGTVAPGESVRLVVQFAPRVPLLVADTLWLSVAGFPCVPIECTGEGACPLLWLQRDGSGCSSGSGVEQAAVVTAAPYVADAVDAAAACVATDANASGRSDCEPPPRASSDGTPDEVPSLSAPAALTTMRASVEAARTAFARHIAGRSAAWGAGAHAAAAYHPGASTLLTSAAATRAGGGGGDAATPASAAVTPVFVLASFVVDLGVVALGTSRVVHMALGNVGGVAGGAVTLGTAASLRIAAAAGVTVAHAEAAKVVALRAGDNVPLVVSIVADERIFNADGAAYTPEGHVVRVVIPVHVRGGPSVELDVRAVIVAPVVTLSPSTIEFGAVRPGQERDVFAQLANTSRVPAAWSVLPPSGLPLALRDRGCYRIHPTGGTLQPGERILLVATFAPGAGGARPYTLRVPIAVAHNPTHLTVKLRGRCEAVALLVDCGNDAAGAGQFASMPRCDFAPLLPGATLPATRTLRVTNASTSRVEVFAAGADLDSRAVESAMADAATTAAATAVGVEDGGATHREPAIAAIDTRRGVVRVRLRADGTVALLHAAAATPTAADSSAAAAVPTLREPPPAAGDVTPNGTRSVGAAPRLQSRAVSAATASDGRPESGRSVSGAVASTDIAGAGGDALLLPLLPEAPVARFGAPFASGRGVVVVVTGPPCSGVSTLASAVADAAGGEARGAHVFNLTSVVLWARDGHGGAALAAQLRAVLPHLAYDDGCRGGVTEELARLRTAAISAVPSRSGSAHAPPSPLAASGFQSTAGAGRGARGSAAPAGGGQLPSLPARQLSAALPPTSAGGRSTSSRGASAAPPAQAPLPEPPILTVELVAAALRARLLRADVSSVAVVDLPQSSRLSTAPPCAFLPDAVAAARAIRLAVAGLPSGVQAIGATGGTPRVHCPLAGLAVVALSASPEALSARRAVAMQSLLDTMTAATVEPPAGPLPPSPASGIVDNPAVYAAAAQLLRVRALVDAPPPPAAGSDELPVIGDVARDVATALRGDGEGSAAARMSETACRQSSVGDGVLGVPQREGVQGCGGEPARVIEVDTTSASGAAAVAAAALPSLPVGVQWDTSSDVCGDPPAVIRDDLFLPPAATFAIVPLPASGPRAEVPARIAGALDAAGHFRIVTASAPPVPQTAGDGSAVGDVVAGQAVGANTLRPGTAATAGGSARQRRMSAASPSAGLTGVSRSTGTPSSSPHASSLPSDGPPATWVEWPEVGRTRWTLEPGQSVPITLAFGGVAAPGTAEGQLRLCIDGCPAVSVGVTLSGTCAVPVLALEPAAVFCGARTGNAPAPLRQRASSRLRGALSLPAARVHPVVGDSTSSFSAVHLPAWDDARAQFNFGALLFVSGAPVSEARASSSSLDSPSSSHRSTLTMTASASTASTLLRFTNDGVLPARVRLALSSSRDTVTPWPRGSDQPPGLPALPPPLQPRDVIDATAVAAAPPLPPPLAPLSITAPSDGRGRAASGPPSRAAAAVVPSSPNAAAAAVASSTAAPPRAPNGASCFVLPDDATSGIVVGPHSTVEVPLWAALQRTGAGANDGVPAPRTSGTDDTAASAARPATASGGGGRRAGGPQDDALATALASPDVIGAFVSNELVVTVDNVGGVSGGNGSTSTAVRMYRLCTTICLPRAELDGPWQPPPPPQLAVGPPPPAAGVDVSKPTASATGKPLVAAAKPAAAVAVSGKAKPPAAGAKSAPPPSPVAATSAVTSGPPGPSGTSAPLCVLPFERRLVGTTQSQRVTLTNTGLRSILWRSVVGGGTTSGASLFAALPPRGALAPAETVAIEVSIIAALPGRYVSPLSLFYADDNGRDAAALDAAHSDDANATALAFAASRADVGAQAAATATDRPSSSRPKTPATAAAATAGGPPTVTTGGRPSSASVVQSVAPPRGVVRLPIVMLCGDAYSAAVEVAEEVATGAVRGNGADTGGGNGLGSHTDPVGGSGSASSADGVGLGAMPSRPATGSTVRSAAAARTPGGRSGSLRGGLQRVPSRGSTLRRGVSSSTSLQSTLVGTAAPPVSLDYGLLRVHESAARRVRIANRGIDPLSFAIALTPAGAAAGSALHISPMSGVVVGGDAAPVTVSFKAADEAMLPGAAVANVTVTDMQSGRAVAEVPITVAAAAVFSRFAVGPPRMLHFGPQTHGTATDRWIEITNDGEFPMDYRIVSAGGADDIALLPITLHEARVGEVGALLPSAPVEPTLAAPAADAPSVGSGRPTQSRQAPRAAPAPAATAPPPSRDGRRANGAAPVKVAPGGAAAAASSSGPNAAVADEPSRSIAAAARCVIGAFSITPASGTVPVGGSARVCVTFAADGDGPAASTARIHVSGFHPVANVMANVIGDSAAAAAPLLYELRGDSVVPAISTDMEGSGGVMEGHLVVPSLEDETAQPLLRQPRRGSVSLERPRAAEDSAYGSPMVLSLSPRPPPHDRTRCAYAADDRLFSFGDVLIPPPASDSTGGVGAAPVGAAPEAGATEKLRLTNVTAVAATVAVRVVDDADDASAVFTVTEPTVVLPPRSSRLVAISFTPTAVQVYRARFVAVVQRSPPSSTLPPTADAEGGRLEIPLVGRGTLPSACVVDPPLCVPSVDGPTRRLNFGTVQPVDGELGVLRTVDLWNDGSLPSTIDLTLSRTDGGEGASPSLPPFSLGNSGVSTSVTLAAGARARVPVTFSPGAAAVGARQHSAALSVRVRGNPFADDLVALSASTFTPDAVILSLPHGLPMASGSTGGEAHITVPDIETSASTTGGGRPWRSSVRVTVVNTVADRPLRFEWDVAAPAGGAAAAVSFAPRVGHIPAGGRADVVVTFAPTPTADGSAAVVSRSPFVLRTSRVTYRAPDADAATTARAVAVAAAATAAAEAAAAAAASAAGPPPQLPGGKGAAKAGKGVSATPSATGPSKAAATTAGKKSPVAAPDAVASVAAGAAEATPSAPTRELRIPGDGPPLPPEQVVVFPAPSAVADATAPEPPYAVVDDACGGCVVAATSESSAEQTTRVLVSGAADAARYDVDGDDSVTRTRRIAFPSTPAWQARTHVFVIRNPSAVTLHYRWTTTAPGASDGTPFTVSPNMGSIAAGCEQAMSVRFAPVGAGAATATAVMSVLGGAVAEPLEVQLAGVGLAALLRIDTPAMRRDDDGGAPDLAMYTLPSGTLLDASNARVLSLECRGIAATTPNVVSSVSGTTPRLLLAAPGSGVVGITNLTDAPLEFWWERAQAGADSAGRDDPSDGIRFEFSRGTLPPGRRTDLRVVYAPTRVDARDVAVFALHVPGALATACTPVIVRAASRAPRVFLDRSTVELPPVAAGATAHGVFALTNGEGAPVAFAFTVPTASAELVGGTAAGATRRLGGAGRKPTDTAAQLLTLEPSSGSIPAGGSVVVRVAMQPQLALAANAATGGDDGITLAVPCHVQGCPSPLSLVVRGRAVAVAAVVTVDAARSGAGGDGATTSPDDDVRTVTEGSAARPHVLRLGASLLVGDVSSRVVYLRNTGNTALGVEWSVATALTAIAPRTLAHVSLARRLQAPPPRRALPAADALPDSSTSSGRAPMHQYLTVHPPVAIVSPGGAAAFTVTFAPVTPAALRDVALQCIATAAAAAGDGGAPQRLVFPFAASAAAEWPAVSIGPSQQQLTFGDVPVPPVRATSGVTDRATHALVDSGVRITRTVRVTNGEAVRDVLVSLLADSAAGGGATASSTGEWRATLRPTLLRPRESTEVVFEFAPRCSESSGSAGVSTAPVPSTFVVNVDARGAGASVGRVTTVTASATPVPADIAVVDAPRGGTVDFGAVPAPPDPAPPAGSPDAAALASHAPRRTVTVVNRSRCAVALRLAAAAVPGMSQSDSAALAAAVGISPAELTLRPGQRATVELRFSPSGRMLPAVADLVYSVGPAAAAAPQGERGGRWSDPRPLLRLAASALAASASLDASTVDFGAVVAGAGGRATRVVHVVNTGDVPLDFACDDGGWPADAPFTVAPRVGRVEPRDSAAITVAYSPRCGGGSPGAAADGASVTLSFALARPADEAAMAATTVRGVAARGHTSPPPRITSASHSSRALAPPPALALALSGRGATASPPVGETVVFESAVRGSVTREVTLPVVNSGATAVTVAPSFSHPHWSGPPTITIPGAGGGPCVFPVTYHPLAMTAGAPTDGVLFVPWGGAGAGVSIALRGVAGPPAPEPPIRTSFAARAATRVTVPLSNWLPTAQRLRASWGGGGGGDGDLVADGPPIITLPPGPGAVAEYPLTLRSSHAGMRELPLRFDVDDSSGEYVLTRVIADVSPPAAAGHLRLTAPVRRAASAVVTIDNPSGAPATFGPPVVSHPAITVAAVDAGGAEAPRSYSFRVTFAPRTPSAPVGGEAPAPEAARPPPAAAAPPAGKVAGTAHKAPAAGGGGLKGGGGKTADAAAAVRAASPPLPADATHAAAASARSGRVELTSPQLGVFVWELELATTDAPPEAPLRVTAALGSRCVATAAVTVAAAAGTVLPTPLTLRCAIVRGAPAFSVPPVVTVAAGAVGAATVPVTFDPVSLGVAEGELRVEVDGFTEGAGGGGGVFTFPLRGVATAPTAAGPLVVPAAAAGRPPLRIDVRNPFETERRFVVATVGPFDAVPAGVVVVPARGSVAIEVRAHTEQPAQPRAGAGSVGAGGASATGSLTATVVDEPCEAGLPSQVPPVVARNVAGGGSEGGFADTGPAATASGSVSAQLRGDLPPPLSWVTYLRR